MTLAIDSGSKTSSNFNQTNSGTISLTTAGTDELVILLIAAEATTPGGGGPPAPTITGVSGGSGLTWARRATYSQTDTAGTQICNRIQEIWWAWASAQQTSQTITVTTSTINTDVTDLDIFAVTGVPLGNAGGPFDTNVSLPGKVAQNVNVDVAIQFTGISTDDAAPFMFGFVWNTNIANPVSNAAASGHTLLTYRQDHAINNTSYESEYWLPGSQLSSATVNLNSGNHRNWQAMIDGIASTGGIPSKRRLGATIT